MKQLDEGIYSIKTGIFLKIF